MTFLSRLWALRWGTAAVMAMALSMMPAAPRATAQEDDPVKVALERDAGVAAIANAGALLRNPATPVIGNAGAGVAIVEFFDYQCPYCKAAEPRIAKLLKDDPGVKLVVKEFPILGPESVVAAKAALAAVRQGKYEAYHFALMDYRGKLTTDVIFATAKQVGLDVERLRKDMDAPEIADQLLANFNLARAMKISVTPGFLVNTAVLSGVSNKTTTSKIDFPAEVAAARSKKQ